MGCEYLYEGPEAGRGECCRHRGPHDPQPEYLIVIIAQTAHLCTATVWDRASDGRCDAGDQRNPQNRRTAAVTTPSAACFE